VATVNLQHIESTPGARPRRLATLDRLDRPPVLQVNDQPNRIQVGFGGVAVEPGSATPEATFVIVDPAGNTLRGRTFGAPNNTVVWLSDDFVGFDEGNYRVFLIGDGPPAIAATNGTRLDGEFIEPLSVKPSGDGTEGGDFVFEFRVG